MAAVLSRAWLAAAVLLPLVGCGNRLAARQAALAPLVGRSEADLVRALGVPARSTDAGGRRFVAYIDTQSAVIPGTYGPPPWGFWGPGAAWAYGVSPPVVVQSVCETVFEIAGSTVVGFSLHGAGCG